LHTSGDSTEEGEMNWTHCTLEDEKRTKHFSQKPPREETRVVTVVLTWNLHKKCANGD